jgi:hypothetical protein
MVSIYKLLRKIVKNENLVILIVGFETTENGMIPLENILSSRYRVNPSLEIGGTT